MTILPQQIVNARRIAGVILVLSALATFIMLVILVTGWSTPPSTTQSRSAAGATGTPSNTAVAPAAVPTFGSTPPAPQPPASPAEMLQREVDNDRQEVEALVGYWVPQLSSKTVGTEADGIIYDDSQILNHFYWLKSRYPDALLLRSDDYASYTLSGYWVVVMPIAYPSGTEANSWCDYQGIDTDNCFAKLILHTGDGSGTTMSRK